MRQAVGSLLPSGREQAVGGMSAEREGLPPQTPASEAEAKVFNRPR